MLWHQLLLQKEREDITALYKSAQPEQSKQNYAPTVASAFSAQELASHRNPPTAVQSAYADPVATICKFSQERNSPNFTAGLQRIPVSASNEGIVGLTDNHVAVACCRQIPNSAASHAGAYHKFPSNDAAAAMHRSLDSTFPSAPKSKDLLPQYLKQHSSPSDNDTCDRLVLASSGVVNTLQTLSESLNDSVNIQSHLEFKETFAHRGMSDEALHNYGKSVLIISDFYNYDCVVCN